MKISVRGLGPNGAWENGGGELALGREEGRAGG